MHTTTTRTITRTIGLAVAGLTVGACGAHHESSLTPDSTPGDDVIEFVSATTTTPPGAVDDGPSGGGGGAQPDGQDQGGEDQGGDDTQPTEDTDPTGTDPTEDTDPGDGTDPTEPVMPTCEDVLATGATLAVGPDPTVLEPGDDVGSLMIVNCGPESVDWTGATVPEVTLDAAAGSLDAGAQFELVFTIAEPDEPGPIEFAIKVSEPGHSHYVDVQARRITNVDTGADDLAPAPGTVTCADGCIASASIEQAASTPDVTVAVTTTIPTDLDVYLLDHEPVIANDEVVLAGLTVTATSSGLVTEHAVSLDGLTSGTAYWVIVVARDVTGDQQIEWTGFESFTPPGEHPELADGGGPSGCATECVTEALLTPDGVDTHLHVESHTPAHFWFWASETPFPTDENGWLVPLELATALASTNGDLESTTWDATVTGLPFDTDLYVAVAAQDLNGGLSYRDGTYRTHAAPMIRATFRTVTVVDDADGSGPGDLGFVWGYDDTVVGSDNELQSLDNGATVGLDGETSFTFPHGELWPSFRVAAVEYDEQDITESCMWVWDTMWGDANSLGDCGYKVNVAGGGINLGMTVEGQDDCAAYGVDAGPDATCLLLQSTTPGDGYPSITAVVSVEYA